MSRSFYLGTRVDVERFPDQSTDQQLTKNTHRGASGPVHAPIPFHLAFKIQTSPVF